MSKNEDEKLVTKGAVKEAIHSLGKAEPERYVKARVYNSALGDCISAIDQLPAVNIKSPEEIERAIKELEKEAEGYANCLQNKTITYKDSCDGDADLLRWVLNQKQDTWTDKELLG